MIRAYLTHDLAAHHPLSPTAILYNWKRRIDELTDEAPHAIGTYTVATSGSTRPGQTFDTYDLNCKCFSLKHEPAARYVGPFKFISRELGVVSRCWRLCAFLEPPRVPLFFSSTTLFRMASMLASSFTVRLACSRCWDEFDHVTVSGRFEKLAELFYFRIG